jgi:hypothetical protein
LTVVNATDVGLNVGIAVDMAEAAQANATSPVSIGKYIGFSRDVSLFNLPFAPLSIAVVDQGAGLKVFYRMDGARQGDRGKP